MLRDSHDTNSAAAAHSRATVLSRQTQTEVRMGRACDHMAGPQNSICKQWGCRGRPPAPLFQKAVHRLDGRLATIGCWKEPEPASPGGLHMYNRTPKRSNSQGQGCTYCQRRNRVQTRRLTPRPPENRLSCKHPLNGLPSWIAARSRRDSNNGSRQLVNKYLTRRCHNRPAKT